MSSVGPPPPNGDENRQGGLLATTFIVTILASIVVALRMVTRIWIVRSVGWDDYTILLATIGAIIGCALTVVQVHYGFGRHRFYLEKWDYIEYTKYSYGEWIQTFQTLMFNKISICFFLLRIPVEKKYIRPIQGTIIALIVSNIVLTLLWILQCNPVSKSWNKEVQGTCFTDAQLQRIIISQGLISIISDFILALFPIVLLWKVQIEARVKAGLCILMGLGLITAACCIVRTVLNYQNVNHDPTWNSVANWYWRSWEVSIGVITASIPALRPGYKTVSAGITSYLSHRTTGRSSKSALINNNSPTPPEHKAQLYSGRDRALGAAAHAVSIEADAAKAHGEGERGFSMQHLPGDKETVDQGIKKTTRIDVGATRRTNSQRSLDMVDLEGNFVRLDFV